MACQLTPETDTKALTVVTFTHRLDYCWGSPGTEEDQANDMVSAPTFRAARLTLG